MERRDWYVWKVKDLKTPPKGYSCVEINLGKHDYGNSVIDLFCTGLNFEQINMLAFYSGITIMSEEDVFKHIYSSRILEIFYVYRCKLQFSPLRLIVTKYVASTLTKLYLERVIANEDFSQEFAKAISYSRTLEVVDASLEESIYNCKRKKENLPLQVFSRIKDKQFKSLTIGPLQVSMEYFLTARYHLGLEINSSKQLTISVRVNFNESSLSPEHKYTVPSLKMILTATMKCSQTVWYRLSLRHVSSKIESYIIQGKDYPDFWRCINSAFHSNDS